MHGRSIAHTPSLSAKRVAWRLAAVGEPIIGVDPDWSKIDVALLDLALQEAQLFVLVCIDDIDEPSARRAA